MVTFRGRSPDRRTQILEAALQVFGRLGLHKARMDDIAREAGVSKGLLYWYFRSKDALIAAILDRIFSDEMRHLNEALAAEGPVSERLRTMVEKSAQDLLGMRVLAPIAFEFYALAGRNRHVREALRRYYALYLQGLTQLVSEGVAKQEFRPDTQPEGVARSLIALFEGTVLLWLVDPEKVSLVDHLREGVALLLQGIRREGP